MLHESRKALLFGAVSFGIACLVVACKQKSREEADPAAVPSATAAPPPSATAAETTPPPAETIAPPVQPPSAPPAPSGSSAAKPAAAKESIKTCCAALHKEEATNANKALYTSAATSCDVIEKLVASGTTKKSAALTQIRASLKGAKLPPGCE